MSIHLESSAVVIDETNSDVLHDDCIKQIDTHADACILPEGSKPSLKGHVVIEVTNNITCVDKVLYWRSTGKSSKKEKPIPMKRKDTQVTLNPNCPPPISPECCDSSLSNSDTCRICQCDSCEIQKDSLLVSPCLCSGSLKFVHQACLQKWIRSSDKMSCELCQFEYQMTKKTKPFREWERLDMTPAERRKVVCSVTFHVIAITCVIWSLYVLIDRTTEEVEAGSLLWPFWTKLIVVAIGFTGGVVFMYVQCKMYLTLCKKWQMYNKVILVSSISDTQREKANHEGIVKISEKQARLEEERATSFNVMVRQETDTV